jgi:hypothetical protein
MKNDPNICDSIGCMRQAIYIREEERLRYPEQLCAACYSKRIRDVPRDESQYRMMASLAPPMPALSLHPGRFERQHS